MDQKNLSIGLLVVALIGFVILIAVDMSKKTPTIQDVPSNWKWKDTWDRQKETQPQEPKNEPKSEPEKPDPKVQVIAENYNSAILASSEMNKKVLVIFESASCVWCTKLKNETFKDPTVAEAMKNYILLRVNTGLFQNRDLVYKFQIKSLPSYVIIDSKETVVKSGKGFLPPDQFLEWLK